ncbi:hypothetical protein IIC65_03230 [Candidatus Sumerlaeota bacterium]|nr:hypothetical protein [Candidatus Sumerlaeota bacterium]
MRIITILVVLAVGVFTFQALYYRSKTNSLRSAAIGQLPGNPAGGFETMKPVFGYSNVKTLGAVDKAELAFFDAVRDSTVSALRSDSPNADTYRALEASLTVLTEAARDLDLSLDDHKARIIAAAREAEPDMRNTLGLTAWDAFVGAMENTRDRAAIPRGTLAEFESWVGTLKQVNRRPFGLREAIRLARDGFRAGIEALGKTPSLDGRGPLIAPLDARLTDSQLTAADRAFAGARFASDNFLRMFRERSLPPQLLPLYVRADYNLAAIRVAHLIQSGPGIASRISGYIAELLVAPNASALPSDAELYRTFINGLIPQLETVNQAFTRPGVASPEEMPGLRALAAWTQSQFGNAARRGQTARGASAQFQALRRAAASTPAGSDLLAKISSSQSVWIVLR